jgi:phosphohistidine phosphatase
VLCSPAQRARQTAALVLDSAGLRLEVRYDERIYDATVERLLAVISQVEESAGVALMIGHNPAFEELMRRLTGVEKHMPTAALAWITLNVERWSDVLDSNGKLESLVKAKELGNG